MLRRLILLAVLAALVAGGWYAWQRYQRAQAIGALSELVFGADVGGAVEGASILFGDGLGQWRLHACQSERDELVERVASLQAARDELKAALARQADQVAQLQAAQAAAAKRADRASLIEPTRRELPSRISPPAVNADVRARLAEYGR